MVAVCKPSRLFVVDSSQLRDSCLNYFGPTSSFVGKGRATVVEQWVMCKCVSVLNVITMYVDAVCECVCFTMSMNLQKPGIPLSWAFVWWPKRTVSVSTRSPPTPPPSLRSSAWAKEKQRNRGIEGERDKEKMGDGKKGQRE